MPVTSLLIGIISPFTLTTDLSSGADISKYILTLSASSFLLTDKSRKAVPKLAKLVILCVPMNGVSALTSPPL